MDSADLWLQFGQIVIAHGLAVASPGPDFALVLRQSLARGRTVALWTSVGIGSGILVHVSYSLLGLGLLLAASGMAFDVLRFAGAAYLTSLGIGALKAARSDATRSQSRTHVAEGGGAQMRGGQSNGAAWLTGFLTNVLNPKATLFFIALFPTVVAPGTPRLAQIGYGLWMSAATAAWFCVVSVVFTRPTAREAFFRYSRWIDLLIGIVFIGFALGLLLGWAESARDMGLNGPSGLSR